MALVQRPTREEVKDAFFDIAEDKAPGPDGYSSGFYKAAWHVIGDEVVKAILEFFTTGRLLKQVNTTMLALIPKRLRLVLDKMISPSQNAFVPGRSIGDNILLAQEMFTGYNRQGLPKRCALKVDLRKAYDTVEWDFLIAALQLFGFPDIFMGWIEECVTTPMFSLMMQQLIDQNEGFSYHWRCKELGLFQLCFADDLLLFCKADVASVQVFRRGLDEFAKLSGLHANPQKSQLIISRSALEEREHLIAALQFQEGHLPLRYLGLPLLASRLSISDCQPSSLKSIVGLKGSSEKSRKDAKFLVERKLDSGYPKVAWSSVCRPKEEGGLGIRDILALNKALMCHHLWNVIQGNQSSIWVRWIAHTHLRRKSVWTVSVWPRTNISEAATLSTVIVDGVGAGLLSRTWNALKSYTCYRPFTTVATLFYGVGDFSTKVVYDIFRSPGPKLLSAVYPSIEEHCSLQLAEPCMEGGHHWASK
ncbi:UNVERIFIED_CONTAM: hypothetical protein Sradi_7031000, partial [Sesamum radiatum]